MLYKKIILKSYFATRESATRSCLIIFINPKCLINKSNKDFNSRFYK